jgi:hypothetical protein
MTVPSLEDVLAEVNRERDFHGFRPIDKLKKGVPKVCACCFIANSLGPGVFVKPDDKDRDGGEYSILVAYSRQTYKLPPLLNDAAIAFDHGAYPDLIWKGSTVREAA